MTRLTPAPGTSESFELEQCRGFVLMTSFMDDIISPGKPDGLQLPMLPYYQEYAYDPTSHKLVVIEFPDKKKP